MKSKVLIILTIVVFTIFSINTSHAVSINLSKINESVKLALEDADKPINISKKEEKNQKSLLSLSLSSKFRNLKEDVQDKVLDVKEYLVNLFTSAKTKAILSNPDFRYTKIETKASSPSTNYNILNTKNTNINENNETNTTSNNVVYITKEQISTDNSIENKNLLSLLQNEVNNLKQIISSSLSGNQAVYINEQIQNTPQQNWSSTYTPQSTQYQFVPVSIQGEEGKKGEDGSYISKIEQDATTTTYYIYNPNTNSTSTMIIDTPSSGIVSSSSVAAVLNNSLLSNDNIITSNINGNVSSTTIVNQNDIFSSGNTLTSNVNGISSSTTIINSATASSSQNLFQIIVNGISSTVANIINSFSQSVIGNTLTTIINGVTATTSVISLNGISSNGNTISTNVNGISSSTSIINQNNISFSSSSGILTSVVNGVTTTTMIDNSYTFFASSTNSNLTVSINPNRNIIYSFTNTPSFSNIKISDGNAASPSISFTSDNGTGIFRDITNAIGFSIAGGEKVRINSAGFMGIGTDNPGEMLHVAGNILANSFIRIGGTSNQFLKADGSVDSTSYLSLAGGAMSNTNLVANLNADLLDGKHLSDIASGTVNFIPKFLGANSLGNSLIYDNGTGVGIGTTELAGLKFKVGEDNSVQDLYVTEDKISDSSGVLVAGGQLSLYYCGSLVVGQDGLTYGTVLAADGKCWLDRNLGATRVATALNDSQAYGDLYQWGRAKDGHQIVSTATTSSLSPSDTPGHNNFIIAPNSPNDWRSPQNNSPWQGANGINNVCPAGFHLPTKDEWVALVAAEGITNSATAYSSSLKLTVSGYRGSASGVLASRGSSGGYWSSSVNGTTAYNLYFSSSDVNPAYSNYRANGFSVRCVKN